MMLSQPTLNRSSPRLPIAPNQRNQMHSPAPMPNGPGYGMPMNNYGGSGPQPPPPGQPGMRGPPNMSHMMPNPDDIMSGGFNGNFNNNGPPPQGMQHNMPGQQNQYNMMQNGMGQPGGMMNMNPHGNMMSPHPPQGPS